MPLRADELATTAALLSGSALDELLKRSGIAATAHANYLRVKPGAGALVGIELALPQGSLLGYLRLHSPARSRELAAKWAQKHPAETPLGPGVRLLADDRGVLFLFPNDAVLRDLDAVAEPRKLKRLLAELPEFGAAGWRVRGRASTFTTVRYKPERRLIQRARLALRNDATGADAEREVFLRFFVDDRGSRLVRLLQELRAQGLSAQTPAPLGAAFDGRLFVEEAIAGHELVDDAARDPHLAEAVADVLVRLHAARTTGLARQTPHAVCANADEGARALTAALPEAAPLLRTLMRRLHALAGRSPQGEATLHGDCHLHQFLRTSHGLVLVDFERACVGDAAFDLGHLCAHAHSTGLRQPAHRDALAAFANGVVSAYRARAPQTDLSALPLYTACGLLDRALLPYRHLEPDWQRSCTALVEAALEATARAPMPAPSLFLRAAPRGGEHVFYPEPGSRWPGWITEAGERRYGSYDHRDDAFAPVEPRQDPALPGLLAHPDAKLIAYRVGRRATLQGAAPPSFIKVVSPRKLAAIDARWRFAASQAPPFPRVPQILASDASLGTLTTSPLPGESLHAVLISQRSDEALLARLAAAIRAMHDTAGAQTLPPRSPERPLVTWVGFVARHDGALADMLTLALDEIEALPPSDPDAGALVHGDLHDRNVFVADAGIGLIDLDGLGVGDAHDDVGNLGAHFVLRALQRSDTLDTGLRDADAWLRAYAEIARSYDEARAGAALSRTLLRLACLYRFRSRWAELSRPLADAALRVAQDPARVAPP